MNLQETKQVINRLLDNNLDLTDKGLNKISINLIGEAGCGKTSIVKEIAEERNAGYQRIELSSLEEIGDLCGIPIREFMMITPDDNEIWVAEKAIDKYIAMGYTLCPTCNPRMSYAIPQWVPTDPDQEFILLLDDFTRASSLFMQAIMSLVQFGEYVSWKLPKKCHLILTSNPDDGTYSLGTMSLDAAQASRMINFNVEFDVQVYANWMEKMNFKSQLINFALLNREIFDRKKEINARSYSMFATALNNIPNFKNIDNLNFACLIANGCFNDETVSSLFVQFINNNLDQLIEAEEIIKGDWDVVRDKIIENVYKNGQYSAAISSTLTIRLINFISSYFSDKLETKQSNVVIKRLIDICSCQKLLFTEDLLFRMIKELVAKYPNRCNKLLTYPQIRSKILS